MEKNRNVQRKHSKKKRKARLKFKFSVLLFLIIAGFAACFALYMVSANLHDNFLEEEFGEILDKDDEQDIPDAPAPTEAPEETTDAPEENVQQAPVNNPVPESAAADASYFESCCLVTDSTLIDMASVNKIPKNNVFGSKNLGAKTCNTTQVESSFGFITTYEIIKDKKPDVVYIMLGSDLGTVPEEEMVSEYTEYVKNLHSALPSMKIYVMQIPPVIYDKDTLSNEMINSYNQKILEMCNKVGINCIDTNTALKSEDGKLAEKYWSYETLSLSEDGYKAVCSYILTHTT